MVDEDVLGNEPKEPVAPDKGQGKDDTVTISKAELDSLHRTLKETQQSERDWANLARRASPSVQAEPEPEPADDPREFLDDNQPSGMEDDTPEKMVNDLASSGVQAIAKRGFITAADAQRIAVETALKVSREMIGRERQKMSTDDAIMTEFPEIKTLMRDPEAQKKSPFWQEMSTIYKQAITMDPSAQRTPAALYLAARAAKASMKQEKNGRAEEETDRRRRSDSQDSRSRGRDILDDADDMLGDEAREVIKRMGITDAEFNASRKELSRTRSKR